MRSLRIVIAAIVVLFAAGAAWAREIVLERFDGEYEIRKDTSVDVIERMTIGFKGEWNGVIRAVPVDYRVPGHGMWDVRLELHGATDDAGAPLRVEEGRAGDNREFRIWVPGARDVTRTVVLRYRLLQVMRRFPSLDEFYWNVTGLEWDSPIAAATATVRLPEGVRADGIRTAVFTGSYGSTASDAKVSLVDERTLRLETTKPLGFREGLTIVIGLPLGAVEYPPVATRAGWFLADNWRVAIPVALLLFFVGAWFVRGRDPTSGHTIVPRWEPVDGLRPAEVGLLADDRVDLRDLSATVVDLAVRGYLRIEEITGPGGGRATDYTLVRLREDTSELETYEQELMKGLFATGPTRVLSTLEGGSFHDSFTRVRTSVYRAVTRAGYFAGRPERVRALWVTLSVVGLLALALYGAASEEVPQLAYFVVLLAVAVPTVLVARQMPRRTRKGLAGLAQVRGLEEYLTTAEAERLADVPPDRFEKLLPYAVALGVAEQWARKFQAIYQAAPSW